MVEFINKLDNCIVIGPSDLESYFLTKKNDRFVSFDYKTKETVLNELFGTFNKKTIRELMKHNNLSYDIAKKYLKFLTEGFSDNKNFKWLYDEQLILVDELYLNLYKNKEIVFVGYQKNDPEICTIINKIGGNVYRVLKIDELDLPLKKHDILNFLYVDDEVRYALNDISKKIKENNKKPSDFSIYCNLDKYEFYLRIYANFYGLPINFNIKKSLIDTNAGRYVLNHIDEKFEDVYNAYKSQNEGDDNIEIAKYLYDFFNLSTSKNYSSDFKSIMADYKLKVEKYIDGINIISRPTFTLDSEIYILGALDDFIPRNASNNDIIDDEVKLKNGLTPSNIKNALNIQIEKAFVSLNNVSFISFANENGKNNPSYLLKDALGFNVVEPNIQKFTYSKDLSYIYYLNHLYRYDFFNDINPELRISDGIFEKQELYDNSYTKINRVQGSDFTLSASSLNTYASCAFSFYLDKILGIGSFESTFSINIGNYYHKIFEKIYDKDFEFSKISTLAKSDPKFNFTKRELVLLEKLDKIIEKECEYIREQNKNYPFTHTFSEYTEKFKINNIPLEGRMDRINIYKNDIVVVDYKTGNPKNDIDKFYEYGIDIQLPFYLMMIKNSSDFKKYNIMGALIQPIDVKSEYNFLDSTKNKDDRFKLQGLVFQTDKTDDENLNWLKQCYVGKKKDFVKCLEGEQSLKDIIDTTQDYVKSFYVSILDNDFKINPIFKKNKIDSCEYCHFKDVCFKTKKDYRVPEVSDVNDVGGEENV